MCEILLYHGSSCTRATIPAILNLLLPIRFLHFRKTDDRNAEGNEEEYGKSLIDSKQR